MGIPTLMEVAVWVEGYIKIIIGGDPESFAILHGDLCPSDLCMVAEVLRDQISGINFICLLTGFTGLTGLLKKTKSGLDALAGSSFHKKLEVAHKNRELATTTIHLQHKNETLQKIKNELQKIQKQHKDSPLSRQLNKVIKMVEFEENAENGWEQFTAHFNEIHVDFFDRLRNDFPDLSHKDLKLCAYLRMNLSTKEIALLMNNTVRGVEGGRYRLRKKLGLDNKANLTEFILRY